jgi:hypothetical protein
MTRPCPIYGILIDEVTIGVPVVWESLWPFQTVDDGV